MPISITDYPERLVVDPDGQTYRLQFRSQHDTTPPIGQLVGVANSDPDAEPIPLTAPDVAQSDVDAEIERWDEWLTRIRSDENGYWAELTLAEVHRRLANAGLREQP
ncbi:hypothetical protein [Mycolicibacterium sp. J2]|uniref:hypothetical protein n=1 Tax=Mycolicibacterium sp. J2 TaxID=2993511 RepID=UPI00224B56A7|nr:hypothetical protein [Mycolicibacterium sp. J2]MCX2715230.1 hypothetical protein [Mycolicibacterium sp. J2]